MDDTGLPTETVFLYLFTPYNPFFTPTTLLSLKFDTKFRLFSQENARLNIYDEKGFNKHYNNKE